MKLKSLRVERRKSGRLDVQLQLSTNPTELQENSTLLRNGGPVPALEAISAKASSYVDRVRTNLNVGNPPLEGLPENVTFQDDLKPQMTDSHVEEKLSSVLRFAKPSNRFIRKVVEAARARFESQGGRWKMCRNGMTNIRRKSAQLTMTRVLRQETIRFFRR